MKLQLSQGGIVRLPLVAKLRHQLLQMAAGGMIVLMEELGLITAAIQPGSF